MTPNWQSRQPGWSLPRSRSRRIPVGRTEAGRAPLEAYASSFSAPDESGNPCQGAALRTARRLPRSRPTGGCWGARSVVDRDRTQTTSDRRVPGAARELPPRDRAGWWAPPGSPAIGGPSDLPRRRGPRGRRVGHGAPASRRSSGRSGRSVNARGGAAHAPPRPQAYPRGADIPALARRARRSGTSAIDVGGRPAAIAPRASPFQLVGARDQPLARPGVLQDLGVPVSWERLVRDREGPERAFAGPRGLRSPRADGIDWSACSTAIERVYSRRAPVWAGPVERRAAHASDRGLRAPESVRPPAPRREGGKIATRGLGDGLPPQLPLAVHVTGATTRGPARDPARRRRQPRVPGLYVLGLQFQRTRTSSLIRRRRRRRRVPRPSWIVEAARSPRERPLGLTPHGGIKRLFTNDVLIVRRTLCGSVDRQCCSRAPVCGCSRSTGNQGRGRQRTTSLDARAHGAGACSSSNRWGVLPEILAAGNPRGFARPRSTNAD
jgi:hypothetical protein